MNTYYYASQVYMYGHCKPIFDITGGTFVVSRFNRLLRFKYYLYNSMKDQKNRGIFNAPKTIIKKIDRELDLKTFEKIILFLATAGFIIHLVLILLNNKGYLDLPFFQDSLFVNPISAIYTPFSFILILLSFFIAFIFINFLKRSRVTH